MNMEQIIESTKHYIAALRKASAAKTRGWNQVLREDK
jgi:hypothetical protein